MRIRHFSIVLLTSMALGQAAPNPSAAPAEHPAATTAPGAAKDSAVAPDAPVITVPNVCHTSVSHSKTGTGGTAKPDCQTVITRAQFEALANALQPNMNPQTKRRLAEVYPRLLVMAQAARKRGLEDKPSFKQLVEFNRLQILSQELGRALKEDADNVPQADIEKYYQDNPEAFEQATLLRIYIPKDKQEPPAKADTEAKEETAEDTAKQAAKQTADQEAMKKTAEDLQKRAAAGEDFDKLQQEAYQAAGIQGAPAPTNIGKMTRNQIPVNQRAVLDLKPGEVSQLFTEPNGYYVYKVVAKEKKSLDQARDEIRTTLAQQRLQDAMTKYQQEDKASLNEAYFGAAGPPVSQRMGPGGPPAPGARPQSPNGTAKPAPPQAPPQ